ncbi:MAG: hypothetical protein O6948_11180, partial [Deltaproteobacteria bacterium]|nr:hypothetical protein [Deltaproteobacteria bacterium]
MYASSGFTLCLYPNRDPKRDRQHDFGGPLPDEIQDYENDDHSKKKGNPVPWTYGRGFGALPLQGGWNIHPVPTVLDRGRIVLSRRSWNGVHPRAYPDPTNKKNLNAFLGRVL